MRPIPILLNAYLSERYKIETGSSRGLVMVDLGQELSVSEKLFQFGTSADIFYVFSKTFK